MKLWRISQEVNDGYDTYSDAVVAAETEESARLMHPGGYHEWIGNRWTAKRTDGSTYEESHYGTWAPTPEVVKVELIGTADDSVSQGIICASFHAG